MKNRYRMLATILAGSMVFGNALTVYAEDNSGNTTYSKCENVYAKLAADGKASDAYIVNHFSIKDGGKITDYGKYEDVKNLTTLDAITKNKDSIEFNAQDGEFYYQGQVENVQLPWNFIINYELDGKSITADELAGKSGKLKINFKSSENKNADESFYDNYLMQVSVTLDCEKADNIVEEGATIADAGADKQLSFTALPGSDADFVIEADVDDFEMSGFSIAAVPYSMDIDMSEFNMDDFTGQISELTDAVNQLNDGTASLCDGLNSLCDGNGELLSGSNQINSGLNQLSSNSATITNASAQIKSALDTISTQLGNADFSGISKLNELPAGLNKLADALDNIQGGLTTLESNYENASAALNQLMQAETNSPTQEEIAALQGCAQNDASAFAAYQKLMDSYQQLMTVKGAYQNVKPVFDAVQAALSSENEQSVVNGIAAVSTNLRSIADSMTQMSGTDIDAQMNTLKNGLSTLAAQYGEFNNGLTSYTGGVDALAKNYGAFQDGLTAYLDGTAQIKDGAGELSDGMCQFADGISDMPDEIQNTIDDAMGEFSSDDYQVVSFTDNKNENVSSVQFVISTNGVEKAKEEKVEETETKSGFWDRLKALF